MKKRSVATTGNAPTVPDHDTWEKVCRRCGECCFEKWIDEDGTIYPTATACRYLDIVTRACRVYHKRFDVGEGCVKLTPDLVAAVQWLPEDCGYRNWLGTQSSTSSSKGK